MIPDRRRRSRSSWWPRSRSRSCRGLRCSTSSRRASTAGAPRGSSRRSGSRPAGSSTSPSPRSGSRRSSCRSATAFEIVKYAGAAYLVFLGIRRLLAREDPSDLELRARAPARSLFSQGVVVNVLNPKTAIFFFAFLPQFVNPDAGLVPVQILLLGVDLHRDRVRERRRVGARGRDRRALAPGEPPLARRPALGERDDLHRPRPRDGAHRAPQGRRRRKPSHAACEYPRPVRRIVTASLRSPPSAPVSRRTRGRRHVPRELREPEPAEPDQRRPRRLRPARQGDVRAGHDRQEHHDRREVRARRSTRTIRAAGHDRRLPDHSAHRSAARGRPRDRQTSRSAAASSTWAGTLTLRRVTISGNVVEGDRRPSRPPGSAAASTRRAGRFA